MEYNSIILLGGVIAIIAFVFAFIIFKSKKTELFNLTLIEFFNIIFIIVKNFFFIVLIILKILIFIYIYTNLYPITLTLIPFLIINIIF